MPVHYIVSETMMVCNTKKFCLDASVLNGVDQPVSYQYIKYALLSSDVPAYMDQNDAAKLAHQSANALALVNLRRWETVAQ